MGYANPIERMGVDVFAAEAQAAGVDGVLVVDYPPEEAGVFAEKMRAAQIDPIFLLAPRRPTNASPTSARSRAATCITCRSRA